MSRYIRALVYGGVVAALVWLLFNEYTNVSKECPVTTVKVRGYSGSTVCVSGAVAKELL